MSPKAVSREKGKVWFPVRYKVAGTSIDGGFVNTNLSPAFMCPEQAAWEMRLMKELGEAAGYNLFVVEERLRVLSVSEAQLSE